jgi:two-component system, response regulator
MTLRAGSSTIVLVEDNPDDAHLAMIEFEDAGVANEIVLLEDGEQIVRYLRRQGPYADAPTPGLILLDLHLPKIEGHEVLQLVDDDADLRQIPIIVVSVPTELTWVEEQFAHLVAGVLPKPILIDPLVELVSSIEALGPRFLVRE